MRIESQSLPFQHAGLDRIVKLYILKMMRVYEKYCDVVSSKQAYYRIAQEGDFGPGAVMNQSTGAPFQDYKTGPIIDIYGVKYGIGFAVSTEVTDSDVYGIVRQRGPKMARAMLRTVEGSQALLFNTASSTYITGPDGLSLANSAHPYDLGTFSNFITNNPGLSIGALEQASGELWRQPTQTGDFISEEGPYILLVPPELEMLGRRLVGSSKFPTTPNNDPNPVTSRINSVVSTPFFTSPYQWGLVPEDKSKNPLKMFDRRKFDTNEDYNINRDIDVVVVNQIWAPFFEDWRRTAFSLGQ